MFDKINDTLERLNLIINGSIANEKFSQLDKDCALNDIRELYELILKVEPSFEYTNGLSPEPEIEVSIYGLVEEEGFEAELESFDIDENNEMEVQDTTTENNTQENNEEGYVIEKEEEFIVSADDKVVYMMDDPLSSTDFDFSISEQEYDIIKNELCDGDNIECDAMLHKLSEFTDFDDAILYIQECYEDKSSSNAVEILVEKLTDKLI